MYLGYLSFFLPWFAHPHIPMASQFFFPLSLVLANHASSPPLYIFSSLHWLVYVLGLSDYCSLAKTTT